MSFALPFGLPVTRKTRAICAAILLLTAAAVISRVRRLPRPWRVDEVPIAFWSWRNQTPSEPDIRAAIERTKASAIFQRAGQIDYQDGHLRRIRAVTGPFPGGISLHLVYNATRSLLSQLESVDEKALADSIAAAFQEDLKRAKHGHARVIGLQIDIDVPTRLLGRYEKTLRSLRSQLNPETQLSITGLPTWMQSSALPATLSQVDFWVPQFYGSEIPERADQLIPISSAKNLDSFVTSARALNKPFYAGLAAYSCLLLYSPNGSLISLRGDMDPAAIASDPNLELIDQRPFDTATRTDSEWRYVFRARADGVIDNLSIHAGELLVIDAPSVGSLRASARLVRELAGEKLLGICVFRLPARDDPATLTLKQVAVALADEDSTADFRISFKHDGEQAGAWLLEVENQGTASAIGGLKIDVPVATGAIESFTTERGASVETICRVLDAGQASVYQPCGQNRANTIRLVTPVLRPGQTVRASSSLRPRFRRSSLFRSKRKRMPGNPTSIVGTF